MWWLWGPLLTYLNLLLLFWCFDQSFIFYTIKLIEFNHKINSSTPDFKENQFAPFTISHIYVFPTRFNLENIMNLNQRAINWINYFSYYSALIWKGKTEKYDTKICCGWLGKEKKAQISTKCRKCSNYIFISIHFLLVSN